jgi:hypothetical protein
MGRHGWACRSQHIWPHLSSRLSRILVAPARRGEGIGGAAVARAARKDRAGRAIGRRASAGSGLSIRADWSPSPVSSPKSRLYGRALRQTTALSSADSKDGSFDRQRPMKWLTSPLAGKQSQSQASPHFLRDIKEPAASSMWARPLPSCRRQCRRRSSSCRRSMSPYSSTSMLVAQLSNAPSVLALNRDTPYAAFLLL